MNKQNANDKWLWLRDDKQNDFYKVIYRDNSWTVAETNEIITDEKILQVIDTYKTINVAKEGHLQIIKN